MRSCVIASMILFCLLLAVDMFVQAQDVEMPTEFSTSPAVEGEEGGDTPLFLEQQEIRISLNDVWFNRLDLLKGNSMIQQNMKRIEDEFRRFEEASLNRGIKRPKIYSAALTREGYEYIWNKDPISAIDSFSKAITLDPSNSQAYYGRGEAYLAKSILNIFSWLGNHVQGYFAGFQDFWIKFFRLGNFFFTTIIGLASWFSLLIVVFLLKYQDLFAHDVGELLPFEIHRIVIFMLAWLILIVPLLLGKGFILLLLFWLVLVWVYMQKGEKILAGLFIVLLFLFPVLMRQGASFYEMYSNRSVHALLGSYYGGWDQNIAQFLVKWSEEHPSDSEPYFLLGMLHRKQGDFYEAKNEYEKAAKLDSSDAKIYNNLGNIYYFLNDYKKAIELYKKSFSYADSAIPHYNLSKAYLAVFEFTEADSQLTISRQINRELVTEAQRLYAPTPNRKLVDEYIPVEDVWKYFASDVEKNQKRAEELWSLFISGITLGQTTTIAFIVLALAFGLGFLREKLGYARHCLMCGQSTRRHVESEKYCSHCMQLFIKRDGVDPGMRNEKMLQVHRYKRKISVVSRLLSIVFPGSGHVYAGFTIAGGIITGVWMILLTRLLYFDKIFTYPYQVTFTETTVQSIVLMILLLICYLGVNIHLGRAITSE